MLQYVFLDMVVFATCRNEEVAEPQLFNWSGLHPWPYIYFEFKTTAENAEIQEVISMGSDPCELIKFMEVEDKPIAHHFVDGLVITQRAVVASDDAGVGTQRNFFISTNIPSGI